MGFLFKLFSLFLIFPLNNFIGMISLLFKKKLDLFALEIHEAGAVLKLFVYVLLLFSSFFNFLFLSLNLVKFVNFLKLYIFFSSEFSFSFVFENLFPINLFFFNNILIILKFVFNL